MLKILKNSVFQNKIIKNAFFCVQKRNLNLLEYQSKKILQENDVNIQNFRIMQSAKDMVLLDDFKSSEYVIKAQILAGGRGKGHFDNGFKGGVHITNKRNEIPHLVEKMVGHRLITKQTTKDGALVKKVMVAQSVNIIRETYVGFILNRDLGGPVLIVSPAGGVDIEAIAKDTPEKIKTIPIDIFAGITDNQCLEAAKFLEFKGNLVAKAADEIKKLWHLFLKIDAIQIEINPLAETDDGRVISVDAKLNFDDNAEFRQSNIFEMDDHSELNAREIEASKYNLNYISMEGNIGCLVNGAGLAMATMDIIKLNGGDPANFLDIGGGVKEDQVLKAFKILADDKNIKVILVNVFGGIVNCSTIANGIVNAWKTINLKIPVIVRLEGTNAKAAKEILRKSNLPIQSANNLDEAASLAVLASKSC